MIIDEAVFNEIVKFLEEMSGDVPYEQRKFKGIIARNEEAKRLLIELEQWIKDTR